MEYKLIDNDYDNIYRVTFRTADGNKRKYYINAYFRDDTYDIEYTVFSWAGVSMDGGCIGEPNTDIGLKDALMEIIRNFWDNDENIDYSKENINDFQFLLQSDLQMSDDELELETIEDEEEQE